MTEYTEISRKIKKAILAVMITTASFAIGGCAAKQPEAGGQEAGTVPGTGNKENVPENMHAPEGEGTDPAANGENAKKPEDEGAAPPGSTAGSENYGAGEADRADTGADRKEPEGEEAGQERIVEGYNIGPATSVLSLKDAYADYFRIGVGLSGSSVNTMMLRSEAMAELVRYHFNSVTLTNLMKPSYLLSQSDSIRNYKEGNGLPAVRFDTCTDALEFCMENGIKMRGHTLVWHAQVPDWFFKEGYESDGALVDRDTMLMRMESYIGQVITYTSENYPGVIYCWDVVNEAVEIAGGCHEEETGYYIRTASGDEENLWYTVIGADYVEKAFEFARKYAPADVKLFYNDYNTFQPLKNEKICALLKDLYAGGLVDGIGMQSYYDRKNPDIKGKTGSVQRAIENFAAIGLEIQITELTINIDEPDERALLVQAMRYQEMMELLTELDSDHGGIANITGVTFFGLMDEYMFYPGNTEYSRLFDGKLQPKEALYRILQVPEEK